VPRALLTSLLVCLALASPLVSTAYGGGTSSGRRVAELGTGKITLRARFHQGPWKRSLSLQLVKVNLTNFSVCAIWNRPAGAKFDCAVASHTPLPGRDSLRLEQSPVARAARRAGSPGWGMLGVSGNAGLGSVLSNLVSGNRPGTFRYRVTLRNPTGHIVATSNVLTVVWHR
jgi:hypothetical protein